MIEDILRKLELLGDEKTRNKYLKDGCDVETFGVKVGELKKLVKEYKLNNNNEIAIALIETKNYDAMYLGFLIMKPDRIDPNLFIKWSTYSNYYRIRIHSLAYGIAENSDFEAIIEYFKTNKSDANLSIYYAALAAKIIIDPTYNNQLMIDTANYICKMINSEQYQDMPLTKVEMHALIGYIGIQIESASGLMLEIAKQIQPQFSVDSKRRIGNNVSFIQDAIDRNTIGKKRKSARC